MWATTWTETLLVQLLRDQNYHSEFLERIVNDFVGTSRKTLKKRVGFSRSFSKMGYVLQNVSCLSLAPQSLPYLAFVVADLNLRIELKYFAIDVLLAHSHIRYKILNQYRLYMCRR